MKRDTSSVMKRDTRRHGGHVRGAIDGLLNKIQKQAAPRGTAVIEAWNKAVEEKATGHTRPVSFKKGTLVVVVENSTWLYKLTLEKRDILEKFNNEYTGRTKANDIRFRLGVFGE